MNEPGAPAPVPAAAAAAALQAPRARDATTTGPPPPPTDLRLVPAALATWLTAGIGIALPAATAVLVGALLAAAALLVLALDRAQMRRSVGACVTRRRTRELRRAPRHRGHGATVGASVLALTTVAACLGVVAVGMHARTAGLWGHLVRDGATVQLEGVVRGEAAPLSAPRYDSTAGTAVRVRVEVRHVVGRGWSGRARAPVLVLGPRGWAALDVGQVVRTVGRLVPTEPGDDVVALLVVPGAPELIGVPSPTASTVAALRDGLMTATADLPADAAGLVPGIAVGDTSRVPADLGEAMRAVSLTHVTAVSGAHVAIILGVVLALTGWVRAGPRAALCAVALVGFVLLVHPEPSVQRAAAMGAVVVLGLLLGRPGRAMPALAASVVVLVLLDPWIARSYGFALSVLATAGLVLIAPGWAARLSGRLPGWLAHGLAVPAAAQAACAPVIILLEPAVALYAVPANLLAAPAVPPATVLGVLATLCGPWWPAGAEVLAAWAGAFATWIGWVARQVSTLPGASLPWPGGVGGALALAVVPVLLVAVGRVPYARPAGWWWARGRRRIVAVSVLAVLLAGAAFLLLAPGRLTVRLLPGAALPSDWAVVACDVGQGSAVLIRSGLGSAVMVDVGPPGDAAARCLDAAGVGRIDLLVLTHLHADHVGGLEPVVSSRPVDAALVTPYDEPGAARADVAAVLGSAGVPVATPALGSGPAGGDAGAVRWDVLAPAHGAVAAAHGEDGTTVNDLSLALHLRAPGVSVAALGDLETDGQRALASAVRRARSSDATSASLRLDDVDVVLVAHHGSARQDPALARLLAAELALVSVGAENTYGHPDAGALALYAEAGARVLRTDRCGTIVVLAQALETVSRCAADRRS